MRKQAVRVLCAFLLVFCSCGKKQPDAVIQTEDVQPVSPEVTAPVNEAEIEQGVVQDFLASHPGHFALFRSYSDRKPCAALYHNGEAVLENLQDCREYTFSETGNHIFVVHARAHSSQWSMYFADEETDSLVLLLQPDGLEELMDMKILSEDAYTIQSDELWFGTYVRAEREMRFFAVSATGAVSERITESCAGDSFFFSEDGKGSLDVLVTDIDSTRRIVIDISSRSVISSSSAEVFDPKFVLATSDAFRESRDADVTRYVQQDGRSLALKKDFTQVVLDGVQYDSVVSESDGLRFISFGGKRYLLLCSEYFCLVLGEDNSVFFSGASSSVANLNALADSSCIFESDFELAEGTVVYKAANLNLLEGATPWVCGASDAEETLPTVRVMPSFRRAVGYGAAGAIVLYNGYISASRPDLYKANSRVQSLGIYDMEGNLLKKAYVSDSPDPVIIVLPSEQEEFRLVVESVYAGEQWGDVCVAAVRVYPFNASWELKLAAYR